MSIGLTYTSPRHTAAMQSGEEKTVLERALEAMEHAKKKATQRAIADFLGISQPSVQQWGDRGGKPEMPNAIRLAEHTGACVEWLLTGRGPKFLPRGDLRQLARLFELWPKLTSADRGAVLERITIMLERERDDDSGVAEELHRPAG